MSEKSKSKHEMETAQPSRVMAPFEEMERWFEDSFPRGWMHRRNWPLLGELSAAIDKKLPRIDVIDRDDEVVVRVEVPGFKKDDLDISLTENSLTVKGTRKHEEKEEKGNFYRCEIESGSFSRTLSLPQTVDTDKAQAKFEDGMLELTIPKISKAKRKRIAIS